MLEMTPMGTNKRGTAAHEQQEKMRFAVAVERMEYICTSGEDKSRMTKREAKKAFGARQVRRAMKRANRKTVLRRHDKHPQHV